MPLSIETPAYLDYVLWKAWIFHIYISLPHSKWGHQPGNASNAELPAIEVGENRSSAMLDY